MAQKGEKCGWGGGGGKLVKKLGEDGQTLKNTIYLHGRCVFLQLALHF